MAPVLTRAALPSLATSQLTSARSIWRPEIVPAKATVFASLTGQQVLPVDIWLTRLSHLSKPVLTAYEILLEPDERERARTFRVEHARNQYLVGRALAKMCLAQRCGVRADEIRLLVDAKGKPHVVEPEPARHLAFNISHTRRLVACAVADHGEIGIDVESLDATRDCNAVARYALSAEEYEDVATCQKHSSQDRFLVYWTLKEAYAKARGKGFRLGFKSFSFNLENSSPLLSFSHSDPDLERWHFFTTPLPDGHRLALAMAPASIASDITFRWINE